MINVIDFREQWTSWGMPIQVPFENALYFTDLAHVICLYRIGQFQVELVTVKPNTNVPKHRHPNVESSAVYINGDFGSGDDIKGLLYYDKLQKERNGTHALFMKAKKDGYLGEPHFATVFDKGAAWLSFERWENKEPSTVLLDWEGEPLDETHRKMLNGQT